MIHLDAILGTLLLRNNCVIIPSFGGFVANNVSAKVDVKNGLITPPTKALSFNKNLNNNDGLIIHHLANEKKISFDEAQSIIALEVQQIKASLNQEKRVNFHNVGFLYINSAGKIAFEQDRFFNLLLSSYGLGTVQFITEHEKEEKPQIITQKEVIVEPIRTIETAAPVEKVIAQPISEKVESYEEVKEVQHPALAANSSRKLISKIIKYAAVAALVPVLFYSYWIPMKTDVLQSGVVYIEDFNPFNKSESFKYAPEINPRPLTIDSIQPSKLLSSITENLSSSTPIFTYPLDDDLFIPVRRKVDEIQAVSQPAQKEVVRTVEAVSNKNKLHAIVGCFSNPVNANELIDELKAEGFNAYQVDVKGGLHRVSAGSSNDRSEIASLRQRLFEKDVSSWVLKK
ncbi:MAG TPA: SPOR domain-containing protein [Brumimicrobium sp.]|nr:SPOR domain-containing protein [Brumimicrobium sp.]